MGMNVTLLTTIAMHYHWVESKEIDFEYCKRMPSV